MSGLPQALVGGLLNPLLTPAHALMLLALALCVGQRKSGSAALLIFAVGLAGGSAAIALAVEAMSARVVLLAVAAALGMMAATAWAPKLFVWPLAAIAGATLALDSPPQAVSIAAAYATLAGTAFGACAMLLVLATIAGHANAGWQRLGLRILGSWIAASAILVLAVQLR